MCIFAKNMNMTLTLEIHTLANYELKFSLIP